MSSSESKVSPLRRLAQLDLGSSCVVIAVAVEMKQQLAMSPSYAGGPLHPRSLVSLVAENAH